MGIYIVVFAILVYGVREHIGKIFVHKPTCRSQLIPSRSVSNAYFFFFFYSDIFYGELLYGPMSPGRTSGGKICPSNEVGKQ